VTVDYAAEKKPARARLLGLLADRQWHAWDAMRAAGGMRYSARLLELKRMGYEFESRGRAETGKDYRLIGKGEPKQKRVKVFLTEEQATFVLGCSGGRADVREALLGALATFRTRRDHL
jgi:hypothetical protein